MGRVVRGARPSRPRPDRRLEIAGFLAGFLGVVALLAILASSPA